MSHFTRIKVQITNGAILHRSLQELGHQVEENAIVRGYAGKTTTADYVVKRKNGYDLGFCKTGDSYEVVADWWGADIPQAAFVNSVTQRYATNALLETVVEQGFEVNQQETLADGTVRVLVGRWR